MEWILGAFVALMTAIVTAGVTGTTADINRRQQEETNKKNEELMRESWAREDNAVQRRKNDLIAAGFSPTLAAGSAAQASGPINLTPAFQGNPDLSGLGSIGKSISEVGAARLQKESMQKDFAVKDEQIAQMQANTDYLKTLEEQARLNGETDRQLKLAQSDKLGFDIENAKRKYNFETQFKMHMLNMNVGDYNARQADRGWYWQRNYPSNYSMSLPGKMAQDFAGAFTAFGNGVKGNTFGSAYNFEDFSNYYDFN